MKASTRLAATGVRCFDRALVALAVAGCCALAVLGGCGDKRGEGDDDDDDDSCEGETCHCESDCQSTPAGSGAGATASNASASGTSSSSTSGAGGGANGGWSCETHADYCWCDTKFAYPESMCDTSWPCCMYWPDTEFDSCQCSSDDEAACQELLDSLEGVQRVSACPP